MSIVRRAFGAGVVLVVVAVLAFATTLYVTAPVDDLRGTITYLPIGSDRPRVAGLAVADNVDVDQVPEAFLTVLLFSEDKKFFDHRGFDLEEMWKSVRAWVADGRRLRGASTISQQLVKCLFLDDARTLWRKLVEAIYAAKLERRFRKDEILELYLNNIEWGDGVYGVRAAAAHYFETTPAELNDTQAATLVTIVPNPHQRTTGWSRGLVPAGTVSRAKWLVAVLSTLDATSTADDGVEPITAEDRAAVAHVAAGVRQMRARVSFGGPATSEP